MPLQEDEESAVVTAAMNDREVQALLPSFRENKVVHVLRMSLSWRWRLTIIRDIAFALAQCHEGRLDPGAARTGSGINDCELRYR